MLFDPVRNPEQIRRGRRSRVQTGIRVGTGEVHTEYVVTQIRRSERAGNRMVRIGGLDHVIPGNKTFHRDRRIMAGNRFIMHTPHPHRGVVLPAVDMIANGLHVHARIQHAHRPVRQFHLDLKIQKIGVIQPVTCVRQRHYTAMMQIVHHGRVGPMVTHIDHVVRIVGPCVPSDDHVPGIRLEHHQQQYAHAHHETQQALP